MEKKQYCARCNKPVQYNPRYPRYICGECSKLDKFDGNGVKVTFGNTSITGGFRIDYWNDMKVTSQKLV